VQYIFAGLDEDYNSVVNSILARSQAISVSELAAQMLAFESRVDKRKVARDLRQTSQREAAEVALVGAMAEAGHGVEDAHRLPIAVT
jgi:hypothetical protein